MNMNQCTSKVIYLKKIFIHWKNRKKIRQEAQWYEFYYHKSYKNRKRFYYRRIDYIYISVNWAEHIIYLFG